MIWPLIVSTSAVSGSDIFISTIRSRAKAEIVEEIAGHVARVDRFDHKVEAMGPQKFGRPLHRLANAATADGSSRLAMPPSDAAA